MTFDLLAPTGLSPPAVPGDRARARGFHRAHGCALAILLLAAGLRFASLGFDLDPRDPDRTLLHNHTDARGQVLDVLGALERGDLEPHNFLNRGPGGFLLLRTVDLSAVSWLARREPGGREAVLRELERNPALLALLHRLVSALAGTLTVAAVMRLAWREFGRGAGLCAGLVLACAYLHVRESHLGTTDTLWTLFLVLALDACFRLVAEPSLARHAQCGLLVGAAASMKYFGAVLALHVVMGHVLAQRSARARGRPAPGLRRLALALALVPVSFLLLFPGAFTGSLTSLREHLGYGLDLLAPEGLGGSQLALLGFHLRDTLAIGLGETALLAALAGLALAWRRRQWFLLLSVVAVLPTLLLTGLMVVRYGLGLLTVLALPAGIALAASFAGLPAWLASALVLGSVAPGLLRSLALDRVWQRTDTRLEITGELRARCGCGEEVLAVGLRTDQPYPLRPLPCEYVNYLVALERDGLSLEEVLGSPPPWILWRPGAPAIPGGCELERLLRERYREVLRLENRLAADVLFLPATVPRSLQIPYARPWTVERPGPPLVLYRRSP